MPEEPMDTPPQQHHHGDMPPPAKCTATERALLLAFALKWRKETGKVTTEQLREFEKEIWLSHIHATIEEMESSVSECCPCDCHVIMESAV